MTLDTEYNGLSVTLRPLDTNNRYPVDIVLDSEYSFQPTYFPAEIVDRLKNPIYLNERLLDNLMFHEDTKIFWAEARAKYPSRRIRLYIDPSAPELHAIPWEILIESSHIDGSMPISIAANSDTPMSRFVKNRRAYPKPISERPIKILIAIAAPDGLADWNLTPIDVKQEMENLQGIFSCRQDITFKRLEGPCTLSKLEEELRQGYHILHFIGHGLYSRRQKDVAFLMADDKNQGQRVPGDDFMAMIDRLTTPNGRTCADQLRLIFLSSCQTSVNGSSRRRGETQTYANFGLAQRLVNDAGIAAVVGMQNLMDMRSAREFSATFYERLLQHGIVDLACNQARAALLTGQMLSAHVPVLYMRLPDGQLFQPDPIRIALQNICKNQQFAFFSHENDQYLQIPVHVMRLAGFQKLINPDDLIYEPTATVEILKELEYIWRKPERQSNLDNSDEEARPMAIALLGDYGSNKSSQLKRLVWETAASSLGKSSDEIILPVYVDMMKYPDTYVNGQNQLQSLILASMATYWPGLTYEMLENMIEGDDVRLRFLFDNGEYLNQDVAYDAYLRISGMTRNYPQHQYLFTGSFNCFLPKYLDEGINLYPLAVMPLNRRRIRYFLLNGPDENQVKAKLLQSLDQSGLYNVVSVPWFLVRMLEYTQAGEVCGSYGQVMQQALDGSLAKMPHSLRAPAKETLGAIAWQMQSRHITVLDVNEVYQIMVEVRGFRQYDLENLYHGLLKCRILMTIGQSHVRFSYPRIQSYFAAKTLIQAPDRQQEIKSIISMLSNPNRLRWWNDTILFICSLLAQSAKQSGLNGSNDHEIEEALPSDTQDNFRLVTYILNQLVYNENLLHSNQIFLAARSLLECRQQGLLESSSEFETNNINDNLSENADSIKTPLAHLIEHVNDAMIWRLNSQNEPNSTHRSHIAYMLGYLLSTDSIAYLVKTAYKKAHFDRFGEPDCDYINVRLAAIVALLRLEKKQQKMILDGLDPKDGVRDNLLVISQIFDDWQEPNAKALVHWLNGPKENSATAIAALALGDLHAQFVSSRETKLKKQAAIAFEGLSKIFLNTEKIDTAVLWSVTYALGMANSQIVIDEIIARFLKLREQQGPNTTSCGVRCKCIAYLIGLIRCQDRACHLFLTEDCIRKSNDLGLTAIAIDSLGRLSDKKHKCLLEKIALGNFRDTLPQLEIDEEADRDLEASEEADRDLETSGKKNREYIQRKAVDALAAIGDHKTIEKLRMRPKQLQIPARANWYPELERAFYRTSEQIYWRLKAEADQSWVT